MTVSLKIFVIWKFSIFTFKAQLCGDSGYQKTVDSIKDSVEEVKLVVFDDLCVEECKNYICNGRTPLNVNIDGRKKRQLISDDNRVSINNSQIDNSLQLNGLYKFYLNST